MKTYKNNKDLAIALIKQAELKLTETLKESQLSITQLNVSFPFEAIFKWRAISKNKSTISNLIGYLNRCLTNLDRLEYPNLRTHQDANRCLCPPSRVKIYETCEDAVPCVTIRIRLLTPEVVPQKTILITDL